MGVFSRVKLNRGLNYAVSFNPRRVFLMIVNDSEVTIYVSEDPSDITSRGIPVYPFEILVFDRGDGDRTESAFYIYAENDTYVRIYEGVV